MKKAYFLLFIGALLFGCYEDKGNYDYVGPYFIPAKISGIESLYDIKLGDDNLDISVTLTMDVAEEEFDYLWYAYKKESGLADVDVSLIDTLSYEKNLTLQTTRLAPDEYYLVFEMRHKETGFIQSRRATLTVSGGFSVGFLYLKDNIDGTVEIDFYPLEYDKSGLYNAINLINKTTIKGQGTYICYMGKVVNVNVLEGEKVEKNIKTIVITTNEEMNFFRFTNLKKFMDHRNVFYTSPEVYKPEAIMTSILTNMMINNGKIHQLGGVNTSTGGFFTDAVIGINNKDYSVAPFYINATLGAMYYDRLSSSFTAIKAGEQQLRNFSDEPNPTSPAGTRVISANNLNSDLLYMGTKGYAGHCHAILKDRYNGGVYAMTTTNNYGTHILNAMTRYTPFVYSKPFALDSKILNSKVFTLGRIESQEMLYYGSANYLVRVDLLQSLEEGASLAEDVIYTFGSDEEITFIDHCYVTKQKPSKYNQDQIIVATYKQASDTYTIYSFDSNLDKIVLVPERTRTGKGKIKDYIYGFPKINEVYPNKI